MERIKSLIRTIPDFPKPGIQFRDITTLLSNPEGFNRTLQLLIERYSKQEFDVVAAIEARGFILGAPLASALNKGFIPVRKPGKLPGTTIGVDYELEYGSDRLEVHDDAIAKGAKVLLVDDLLATGGTMLGACQLMERIGAEVLECAFVIELPDLKGRKALEKYPVFSMVSFEGD